MLPANGTDLEFYLQL